MRKSHIRILFISYVMFMAGCSTHTIDMTRDISDKGIKYAVDMQAFTDDFKTERIRQADVELKAQREVTQESAKRRDFLARVIDNTEEDLRQINKIKQSAKVLQEIFEDLEKLSGADYTDNNRTALDRLGTSISNYNATVKRSEGLSAEETARINGLLTQAFDSIRANSIKKHSAVLAKPVGELILLNTFMIHSFHEGTKRNITRSQILLKRKMASQYTDLESDFDYDVSSLFEQPEILETLTNIEQQSQKMFALWNDYVKGEGSLTSLDNHLADINTALGYASSSSSTDTMASDTIIEDPAEADNTMENEQ